MIFVTGEGSSDLWRPSLPVLSNLLGQFTMSPSAATPIGRHCPSSFQKVIPVCPDLQIACQYVMGISVLFLFLPRKYSYTVDQSDMRGGSGFWSTASSEVPQGKDRRWPSGVSEPKMAVRDALIGDGGRRCIR